MIESLESKERQIIPRWRDFATTASLGELNAVGSSKRAFDFKTLSFGRRISEWQANQTKSFASDLVGSALFQGKEEEATDAARQLLAPGSFASQMVRRLARKLLKEEDENGTSKESPQDLITIAEEQRIIIRQLRKSLRAHPHNPIAWTEIARSYASVGHLDKAKKAMEVALQLAPNGRFFLRSGARLYLHTDEPDRAHELLRGLEVTRFDPWLLATEIAVARICKRTSKLLKLGHNILRDPNFHPLHITELASVIGTLEFNAGNVKKARKAFRMALKSPNDNSLAQIIWVAEKLRVELVEPRHFNLPLSFEANTIQFTKNQQWEKAMIEARRWLQDQPFSTWPALHGSYISSTFLENYTMGEHFASVGLVANPNEFGLLNNLVFALANQGRTEEAQEKFSRINSNNLNLEKEIIWHATKGLLQFRKGLSEEGRFLYRKAIELASVEKFGNLKAIAAIYLAKEEMLSKSTSSEEARQQALKLSAKSTDPKIKSILRLAKLDK
jgi:tetratricopeptide (TPR) repeat protein